MPVFRPVLDRFPAGLLVSLLIHGAVLGWPGLGRLPAPQRPPVLEARLVRPAEPVTAEPLLKNTLTDERESPRAAPMPPPPRKLDGPRGRKPEARVEKAREQAAQRKLAKHLFYPEEAVRQGLEGDVRLLLKLDDSGRVVDAAVAAGSGHAILDRAALSAAYNMGSLPDAGVRELILPVVFRLQ